MKVKDLPQILPELEIIAGENGITNKITSVTILDAPDGTKWLKGNEFILSSLFPFQQSFNLALEKLIPVLAEKKVAALGIKLKRYLNSLSPESKELARKYSLPIVSIPYKYPWIKVINSVMSEILDRQTEKFNKLHNIRDTLLSELLKETGLTGILSILNHLLNNPLSVFTFYDYSCMNYPQDFKPELDKEELYSLIKSDSGEKICEKTGLTRYNKSSTKSESILIAPVNNSSKNNGYLIIWEKNNRVDEEEIEIINQALPIIFLNLHESKEIIKVKQNFKEELLQQLLSRNIDSETSIQKKIDELNIHLTDENLVCILEIYERKFSDINKIFIAQQIKKSIINYLNEISDKPVFHQDECLLMANLYKHNQYIIVLPQLQIDNYIDKILNFFASGLNEMLYNKNFYAGIGRNYKGYSGIADSYDEAQKALTLCHYQNKNLNYYDNLGLYRLILETPQKEKEKFFQETIFPVIEYDQEHGGELLKTLMKYLENGGNYHETASKMYVHYNTIRYRIKKIEKITGFDLHSLEDLMELCLGVKLMPFLSSI